MVIWASESANRRSQRRSGAEASGDLVRPRTRRLNPGRHDGRFRWPIRWAMAN